MVQDLKRTAGAPADVVSVKISLVGISPPIWRRIHMPADWTLRELHDAIQAAMGWYDTHLHAFRDGKKIYGDLDSLEEFDAADETRVTLNRLIRNRTSRLLYEYDFGDSWDHVVLIEKTVPAVKGQSYPVCVAGKRACPPEDCGGIWGYQSILETLDNPNHPDYKSRREWLSNLIGDRLFDPQHFSLDEANAALAAHFNLPTSAQSVANDK